MNFASFKNARIVRSSWLEEGGRRLDCNPYMSGALEAREMLRRLSFRKDALHTLTSGHEGGIYNGPIFARLWVDEPKFGVPFLSGSDVLAADLSALPLLKSAYAKSSKLAHLEVQEGMTLITCSGTIGRMSYVRPDMAGMWSSQHIMKVVPDPARIPPGYLFAFLSSRYGVPLVVSGTYGAIIQHIEPQHIVDIEVPRLGADLEAVIDRLINAAANLRSAFQRGINQATSKLLAYAGVEDCQPHKWHALPPQTAFSASVSFSRALRAANYSPRVRMLLRKIEEAGSIPLGAICKEGQLSTGARFKRIDCAPSEGVRLVGQKQAFWMQPEGRWISPRHAPRGIFAADESVFIASSGTLGENEVYCRPILVTGRWLEFAYSQHFLRVVSGDSRFSGAYLFAYLRSELAFRALRSMSTGSKQQEIHFDFVSRMPVPLLTASKRSEIETLVRAAFRDRDQADALEAEAVQKIEAAIGGNN
ncbi:methylation-associated defense system restriction endonuclease subunit S MAD5 [Pseudomonas sp. R1-6]|uniref:methylation-associated defense system restriction endonuclease subunit S MAD5 n=1 Tax=Pseudomonas sp. R1-6 TaxID=2817397 RepID=UPI003DA838B2